MQEIYQTAQVKTWLPSSSSIMLEKRNSYIVHYHMWYMPKCLYLFTKLYYVNMKLVIHMLHCSNRRQKS